MKSSDVAWSVSQSYSVKRIWKRRHLNRELGTGRAHKLYSKTEQLHENHFENQILWHTIISKRENKYVIKETERAQPSAQNNEAETDPGPLRSNKHSHKFPQNWLNHSRSENRFTGRDCFFIIKPTRSTNFTNLFWHENLHVSDISSVHHQEFIHCTLSNGICHTVSRQLLSRTRMELLESCLQTCMTCTIAKCTVNKILMMDRGNVRNT